MNIIKERIVNSLGNLLTRFLVKHSRILENNEELKTACPELEMLALYLEHDLTDEQIKMLEIHMTQCRLCRKTVINAFNSRELIVKPTHARSKTS
jgi:hypothetical protein